MSTTSPAPMPSNPTPPPIPSHASSNNEPKYGGFTRFEIELEFVQSLSSPLYLSHLASQKHLSSPAFIAYLRYLQYWSHPSYSRYLSYPGPTLKNLELLQQERFREEVLRPDVVGALVMEGGRGAGEWFGS